MQSHGKYLDAGAGGWSGAGVDKGVVGRQDEDEGKNWKYVVIGTFPTAD